MPTSSKRATHTIRTASGAMVTMTYGRKQAIHLLCTECLGFETHPNDCPSPKCPVFPFRGRSIARAKGKVRT